MIATLTGEITQRGEGFVIVDVNGVGYKVNVPEGSEFELEAAGTYYVHETIRDTERHLHGFLSLEALRMFWKLTSVSGVGPSIAQKIVYAGDIQRVKQEIQAGDLTFLTGVKGVGKKTAQKVILELKGTLAEDEDDGGAAIDGEAVDALVSLGYKAKHARKALKDVDAKSTEERVKHALKKLGT